MKRTSFAVLLGATAAFALSACGVVDLDTGDPAAPAKKAPVEASAAPATEAPAEEKKADLKAVSTNVGQVVSNAEGYVLYRFEKDTPNPAKSTCYGACADSWPAVEWTENLKLEGIDKALLGKTQRTDGSYQVTINGWPVYRYNGDTQPGETKGQGVGKVWFAITPQGKKAGAAAPPAPKDPAPSKSAYSY
jgi:predicted lipoprotein with Yx(FWY)xxD motif